MKKLLAAFLILVSGSTWAQCPRPTLTEAAALDVVSTVAAVAEGARETNPLGLVGSTILKGLVLSREEEINDETKTIMSALWTGAGVNNIMVLFGAGFYPAIVLGVIVGTMVIDNNNCEKEN